MPRLFLLLALLTAEPATEPKTEPTTEPKTEPKTVTRRIVPGKPSAANYESRPATEARVNFFGDPLRSTIVKAVIEAGRRRGTKVVPDARVDAAMTDLARSLREDERPRNAAVEFVLSYHGIVEPYPRLVYARGPTQNEKVGVDALLRDLPLPDGGALVTVGIGIDRVTSTLVLIVALQDKSLDLDPMPRQLPAAGRVRVSGRLLADFVRPHLYVTDPRGQARTLPAETKGKLFSADLPCDRGNGRYQVEVFGDGARGPTVLANFPLYCGVAPPATFGGAAGYASTTPLKPPDAEALLLTLVNRDRQAAGLPAVRGNAALAAVARAHSQDMMANDYVGHLSPTTGGPADRVTRAGLTFRKLSENVGRNGSVEELETGLMASPGHRTAILDPQATEVGVGIAISAPSPADVVVYGTELFR